jgi:hypothetical protein
MHYLEQACRLQVAATQGGQKVVVPNASVAEHTAQEFESFESKEQRAWAVAKFRLDRECTRLRDLMRERQLACEHWRAAAPNRRADL